MLLSYWRSYSEAGRVIVCAALIAAALAWLTVEGGRGRQAHDQTEQPELRRLYSPRHYQPHCESPESPEEADLCAQGEMAKAARDLYDLTWWQFWVTIVGTSAVLVSLKFTRDALKIAREANQVERDIGEAQVRAYLAVESPAIGFEDQSPIFKMRLRNTGNSPAMFMRASCRVMFGIFDMNGAAECTPQMLFLGSLSSGEASGELPFNFDVRLSDHPSITPKSGMIRMMIDLEWINAFQKEDGSYCSFLVKLRNPFDDEKITATLLPEGMTLGKRFLPPISRHP